MLSAASCLGSLLSASLFLLLLTGQRGHQHTKLPLAADVVMSWRPGRLTLGGRQGALHQALLLVCPLLRWRGMGTLSERRIVVGRGRNLHVSSEGHELRGCTQGTCARGRESQVTHSPLSHEAGEGGSMSRCEGGCICPRSGAALDLGFHSSPHSPALPQGPSCHRHVAHGLRRVLRGLRPVSSSAHCAR